MSRHFLRVLTGKSPTRDVLKNLGIIQEDGCVLCNSAAETIRHLFFACPFAAYLWQLCRLKLGITIQMGSLIEAVEFFFFLF